MQHGTTNKSSSLKSKTLNFGCTAIDGLSKMLGFSQSAVLGFCFLPWLLSAGCKDFACAIEVGIDMATDLPHDMGITPGLLSKAATQGRSSAQHVNVLA